MVIEQRKGECREMDALKQTVAKNITALRTASKLTQLELGNKISYSDKAVSKWERGEAIPDAYVLLKMSSLFGVSVDYILTPHEENESIPLPTPKKPPINRIVLTLIALVGVYTVATLAYVILHLLSIRLPMIYQYSFNVSAILLVVFNSLWGKPKYNVITVSLLVNSIILTVYLLFLTLSHNWWELLLLCIPAETIVVLCFMLRKHRKANKQAK